MDDSIQNAQEVDSVALIQLKAAEYRAVQPETVALFHGTTQEVEFLLRVAKFAKCVLHRLDEGKGPDGFLSGLRDNLTWLENMQQTNRDNLERYIQSQKKK